MFDLVFVLVTNSRKGIILQFFEKIFFKVKRSKTHHYVKTIKPVLTHSLADLAQISSLTLS